jgi:excisionase family DNA binding protein
VLDRPICTAREVAAYLDPILSVLADKIAERLRDGTPAPSSKRLMSTKEAAAYIGRSQGAVQQLVARGDLAAIRADRRIHIETRELDAWIERNRIE